MAKDFDELLSRFGKHGTYQKYILYLVISPTSLFVGFYFNMMLFQMAVPEHWCHVPGRERTNMTEEEWKEHTIPMISGKYASCQQYEVDWITNSDGFEVPIVTNETHACGSTWDYSTTEFISTWATDYQWFCEKESYSNIIYSCSLAGSTVGTLILPMISDKYTGRRIIYYLSLALPIAFTIPLIWLPYFGVHAAFRFIAGLAFESHYQLPYLIGLEYLSPEKRALASMLSFMFWTFGMCATSLISWLLPRWKYLAFISCVPFIASFGYWRYLPESPRWLLAHGKITECADIIMQIAKVNRKPQPSRKELELELKLLKKQEKEDLSLTHVLRYPKLRRNAIILHILYAACFFSYGITLLSMNILSSNFFLSHFILSIFELPSNFLGCFLVDFLGRRFTMISTILLSAIFCVAACFCIHDKWALLAMLGFIKLFTTQFIYIDFVMTTEILPTPVRATGFAWMLVCGLLATTFAPYALTSAYGEYFPYLLMLGLLTLSLLIAWPLPETIGLPLPQTFHDAETMDVGRPLTTWIHRWNSSKFPSNFGKSNEEEEKKSMIENGDANFVITNRK